jgi:hypothetical protein
MPPFTDSRRQFDFLIGTYLAAQTDIPLHLKQGRDSTHPRGRASVLRPTSHPRSVTRLENGGGKRMRMDSLDVGKQNNSGLSRIPHPAVNFGIPSHKQQPRSWPPTLPPAAAPVSWVSTPRRAPPVRMSHHYAHLCFPDSLCPAPTRASMNDRRTTRRA